MSHDRPVLTLKRKKVAPPPPPPSVKKETPAETFAREVAPPQPKKKVAKKPCGHPPRLMDPDEALMLLAAYWPALVMVGECRLMKVGIREEMLGDIGV